MPHEKREERLLEQLAELKQLPYLCDCWISYVAPGGRDTTYPRLQSRKKLWKGKKVKHIRKRADVGEYQGQIERGREIRRIEKLIAKHQLKNEQQQPPA
jgi:hypothetical protein